MRGIFPIHWMLVSAIWYFVNGVLHDIFVIRAHQGKYDRELLRLLMDGHVLILSGVLAFLAYRMSQNQIVYGPVLAIVTGLFMLIYCALIFPFLKSIVTLLISLFLIVVAAVAIKGI